MRWPFLGGYLRQTMGVICQFCGRNALTWFSIPGVIALTIGKVWTMGIIAEVSQIPHWNMNVVFCISTDAQKEQSRFPIILIIQLDMTWSWVLWSGGRITSYFKKSLQHIQENKIEQKCVSSNSIHVVIVFPKGHSWNLLGLVVVGSGPLKWVVNRFTMIYIIL